MTTPLVRLDHISRRFGAVVALDGATLEVRAGQVHGVLGENGAGKTTLLNILGGMLVPDSGRIEIDGNQVTIPNPRVAWSLGIGLVHQHFKQVPRLTVLENLALGGGPEESGWSLRYGDVGRRVAGLIERTGLDVPLGARIEELGVGDRQRVEILKALLRDPRVLVLDEPTAVLAPSEVDRLFALLRSLAREGRAIVLVAHKLDEVLSIADRMTVLRGGRTVLTADGGDVDASLLTGAMVGRALPKAGADTHLRAPPETVGSVVASLQGVGLIDAEGRVLLDGVSLAVRRGEIVGIAGIEGNGQRELARVLAGLTPVRAGTASLPSGVGFISQDRSTEGLALDFDLVENVALAWYRERQGAGSRMMDWATVKRRTHRIIDDFDVRADGAHVAARTLSGGNQQRLVVGRELGLASDLLVAENPTRGLDVQSASFVHEQLRRIVADVTVDGVQGHGAVVLISTDLDEVLSLADRVFVLHRGRLSPVREEERSRSGVGALMLSGSVAG